MHSTKISCALIGGDTLLTQCGELLLSAEFEIKLVISDNQIVKGWAAGHQIPTRTTSKDYVEALQDLDYDYLFAITHLALIPDAAVESPKRGAINFHDGPLPHYAGLNTPMWALIEGATSYGITWHEMTAGIDTGDVLITEPVTITEEDTALSLNTKCFSAAMDSFPRLLEQLRNDTLNPQPQDLTQRRYYGRADRPANLGLIDWKQPASDVERLVRALNTGRYENVLGSPKVFIDNKAYIVDAAYVQSDGPMGEPDSVSAVSTTSITVCCGDKQGLELVSLRTLQGETVNLSQLNCQQGASLQHPFADLEAIAESVGKAESFWKQQLTEFNPAALPYRLQVEDIAAGDSRGSVTFELPPTHVAQTKESIASVFASFLARVNGSQVVSLLVAGGALCETARKAPSILAPYALANLTFPEDVDVAQTQEAGNRQISKLISKAPFLRDLIARQADAHVSQNFGPHAGVAVVLHNIDTGPIAELELHLQDNGQCRLEYAIAAYSAESINRLQSHFLNWLTSTTEHSDKKCSELDLLSCADREKLLQTLNQTEVAYDESQLMLSGFDAQVKTTPDAIAIVANGKALTYAELNEQAINLAHRLIESGAEPGTLVGVYVNRSVELMVATLGIIKSGAAYVPLDPAFPADRIAFMIEDSAMPLIVTEEALAERLPASAASLLLVDDRSIQPSENPQGSSSTHQNSPTDLAYVIYTSGSTGKPKGVMLEHRNVVNFFVAMDGVIPGANIENRTWLAVTSLSFDISILELFWTINRGFKVVIYDESGHRTATEQSASQPSHVLDMGLFMWGNDDGPGPDKYKLLLEGSKFFDQNGFHAVWTPERHFHAFGGPYPNPAVTGAAVAAITQNIRIRAGSCVVPLHHPARIAEEWGVVDNLSNGRVEIAAASGWNPNDFVLRPENHADNKRGMYDQLEQVRALWRGEKLTFPGPLGDVEIESLPRPVQKELPCWITTAGNPDTWKEAGRLGLNVLTHLLGQTLDEVKEKTRMYREARKAAGHDPATGRVALMLHTFVGKDNDEVREIVREPMKDYLSSSMKLAMDYAWSFPAFKRPGGNVTKPEDVDLKSLSEEEVDTILNFAFERYFVASGLFGDEATCLSMLAECTHTGVDEIACLMDFGVDTQLILESLPRLKSLREKMVEAVEKAGATQAPASVADLITTHNITHLQCTPSTARMYLLDTDTKQAIQQIPHLLLGGEALPDSLAREIKEGATSSLSNMYGPTETTIWSMVSQIENLDSGISIGRPIANTQIYILDKYRKPLPQGLPGELYIGGKGVARGYLNRPELTAERFFDNPFIDQKDSRMYATGDLAAYREDGTLDYLGRTDFQVKVRGYRIELGEIEAKIEAIEAVNEAAVVVRTADDGDQRMVAYVCAGSSTALADTDIRAILRSSLPEYMIPNEVVVLDEMPRTANGKLDRKALLQIKPVQARAIADDAKPKSDLEMQIAELWKDVLKLDEIGLNENFFDLGGHSLLVVQLHNQLKDALDQPISLTDLYQYTTVATLANFLSAGVDNSKVEASASRGAQRRAQRRRRAS
ncbi:MAG: MupA/Atu3671 family FMN-dependent luciferase-like monooxygenase [bacterium]